MFHIPVQVLIVGSNPGPGHAVLNFLCLFSLILDFIKVLSRFTNCKILYFPYPTAQSVRVYYTERGSHRIRRHDAQFQLLAKDLAKAARHPVIEDRPLRKHRERPDIRALGGTGGTDLFDVTICQFLSQARVRDTLDNQLGMLKAAWTAKVSRYERMMQTAGTNIHLLPVPQAALGGWPSDSHQLFIRFRPPKSG